MLPHEKNGSDERRQGAVSPFGTLENRNQWSSTYKKIFDSFPQYDFLRSFQRSELADRFEQPKEVDSQYAQIRKTPSPVIREQGAAAMTVNNGGGSPGNSPRGILRKTPSPAPTYYSPPMYNNDNRRDSNDTTLSLPHRKISFSSQSSPPLSILRRDSHDSSIRGKKRVSICEERHNVSDGRDAMVNKILENDVSSDLRNAISRVFRENEDVDCEILCETHLPEVHSLERTGRLRSNDKKVYFNLQQNLCLGNSREAVGSRHCGPPANFANFNLPVKDTLVCEDHQRFHSPPIMEKAAGQREYPRSVVYPAGTLVNQKKPICRLDSTTTTGSNSSGGTSLMSELKNIHNLLQMKGTSEHKDPVSLNEKSKVFDCESPMLDTESRSWSRSRPNCDPMQPQLISIVREKVECGRELDWADLFILKTFHLSTVHPMETELFKLLLLDSDHPEDIETLRDILNQEYTAYQRILQNCSIHSSVYTSLAHSICLADSYWFHARIIDEYDERSRLYRKSIDTYSILLSRAERSLSPEDISLIHVVEKISAILAESRNFDPDLILRASLLIDKAERRLDVGRETEARRRIERCKKNLAEINTYCHVPV